jgi:hypothetical protein
MVIIEYIQKTHLTINFRIFYRPLCFPKPSLLHGTQLFLRN